jgi:Domain of unknown function (DUF6471)
MVRPSQDWQNRTRGILRAELARRNIGNRQLVRLLADIGVEVSEQNLANKLARGSFNAVFMIQVLDAIGCKVLRLKEDE